MYIRTKSVFIWLIICHFFLGLIYADNHLETEIEQLKKARRVTGSAVGFGGSPGEFFNLSKVFLQKGKEEDILKLTEDENPVVRSMGILCLAKHTKSANKLRKHITDSGIIYYFPGGCMGSQITVGNFVRKLLLDVNHLDRRNRSLSLISEDELIGLDIEILSKDSTTSFHDISRKALSDFFAKKRISLITLSNLKEYAPNLKTYQIIKAVGRLDVSPRRKNFLISCLKNKNLDTTSRLAAGSALTRYPINHALNTLKKQRIDLNSIEQGNWGDIFLETIQKRIAHEKLMRSIRAGRARSTNEMIKDAVNRVLSNSHPLAIPDFRNNFSLVRRHDLNNARKAANSSLIDLSRNLDKYNQPWNTYSDTGYLLRFMTRFWVDERIFKDEFTEAERIELEANIQNALNNHFEGKK
ncbi:MAG: hypothetical protein ACYS6K_07535 [Planctomycetota bacterium]